MPDPAGSGTGDSGAAGSGTEPAYDPQAAKNGWEATAALRSAIISPPQLMRVDFADVAVRGLKVARKLEEAPIRAALESMPAPYFDIAMVDRMEACSWAVYYAHTQRRKAEAGEQGGRVRATTLEKSLSCKGTMMRVGEYLFVDHPQAGPVVAAIRSGTGHSDLATDLTMLADLYHDYEPLLAANGGGLYDAADEDRARSLAAAILHELGDNEGENVKLAKEDLSRAFVVLRTDYDRLLLWVNAIWPGQTWMVSLFARQ